jgi:iron complex outermembrane recepter protein
MGRKNMEKRIRRALASVLFIVGAVARPASAAEELFSVAPANETDFFSELPLVLSVTRLQQNQHDVPGFVTVIDAETIRYSGARDLAELLRGVPGFQVAFNPYGAPIAGYHGLVNDVPKGLQVLVDGRTQYNMFTEGGVGWSFLDVSLDEIDHIEVLRGSNSPAYGSNSFMGVVNIITRPAAETRGASAKIANGNPAIQDRFARVGFGGSSWSARLSAESTRDDGLPGIYDQRSTERYNGRFEADLPNRHSVRLMAGLTKVDLGIGYLPSDNTSITSITNPRRIGRTESNYLQANWRHQDERYGDTEVKAYRVKQTMDDLYKIAISGLATNFNNSGEATRHELEVQHTIALGRWRVVGGLGWREDVATHGRFFGEGREVSQTIRRAFGQVEWRPVHFVTSNLGATAEDDSLSGGSVAPRAAVNLHFTPTQTIKMIVSKSRRLPTLFEARADERAFETVGAVVPVGTLLEVGRSSSGQVRPETVISREIGYFGEFRKLGLNLDARVFQEKLKDFVWFGAVPITGPCPVFEDNPPGGACEGVSADYFNVLDARIRGWEAQVVWRPAKTTWVQFSHTRTRIETEWTSPRPVATDLMLYLPNSAPRSTTAISARQRLLERWTIAAAHYDVGAHAWTPLRRTDAYHRLDWQVAYAFGLAGTRAELAWTVRSDGGDYSEFFSREASATAFFPENVGRRHFVSLRVDY